MQWFLPKATPPPILASHTNQLAHLHRRAMPSRGQCVAIVRVSPSVLFVKTTAETHVDSDISGKQVKETMQTLKKIKQRIIQKHEKKKKYSTKLYVASVISKMAGFISAGVLPLRGDYALMQPAVIMWTE